MKSAPFDYSHKHQGNYSQTINSDNFNEYNIMDRKQSDFDFSFLKNSKLNNTLNDKQILDTEEENILEELCDGSFDFNNAYDGNVTKSFMSKNDNPFKG